jgi:hypothetical protein
MEVQAVTLTLMGIVGELIGHLIKDFKTATASHHLTIIVEGTLQGGLEIKAGSLIPDPYVNALLGHLHLDLNRGIRWQMFMGMTDRIGESFNQG